MKENKYKKDVCLPPIVKEDGRSVCPYDAYCILVSEIPYGMIASYDSILECASRVYGEECQGVESCYAYTHDVVNGRCCFWRVVTKRGHLLDWEMPTRHKEKLECEGIKIRQPYENREIYVVEDYKSHLFDFGSLHITARLSDAEYQRQCLLYIEKNSPKKT